MRIRKVEMNKTIVGWLHPGVATGDLFLHFPLLHAAHGSWDNSTSVAADFNQPGGDHDALLHDITAAF